MKPFNVVKTKEENYNCKFGFCMQLFINWTDENILTNNSNRTIYANPNNQSINYKKFDSTWHDWKMQNWHSYTIYLWSRVPMSVYTWTLFLPNFMMIHFITIWIQISSNSMLYLDCNTAISGINLCSQHSNPYYRKEIAIQLISQCSGATVHHKIQNIYVR
jgi:hypothetical protein